MVMIMEERNARWRRIGITGALILYDIVSYEYIFLTSFLHYHTPPLFSTHTITILIIMFHLSFYTLHNLPSPSLIQSSLPTAEKE